MGTPRILNQEQERVVALSYFCGVDAGYIKQQWNVSDATTKDSIRGKRSHAWNDPLVEFYRSTKDHGKNATHLYLVFNGQGEGLPNTDLIDAQRDCLVYQAVDQRIFTLSSDKLIEETRLETILGVRSGASSEDRLLRAIFGEQAASGAARARQMVSSILYPELKKAYHNDRKVYIPTVYKQVAEEIYARLRHGLQLVESPGIQEYEKQLEQKRAQTMREVLGTLEPRERSVLKDRFGINFTGSEYLEAVSASFAATRDRIRQIETKALRKLRHPSRSRKLKAFLEGQLNS